MAKLRLMQNVAFCFEHIVLNLLWPALWSQDEVESARFNSLGRGHAYLKKITL